MATTDLTSIITNVMQNPCVETFSTIPWIDYDNTKLDTLISWFCEHLNNKQLRIMIDVADEQLINRDTFPLVIRLFCYPSTEPHLAKIIRAFPDKAPVDYFIDLVNSHDDVKAVTYAAELEKYFKLLPQDWQLLYSLTEDSHDVPYPNQMLRHYFYTHYQKKQDQIKPKWIIANSEPCDVLEINTVYIEEALDILCSRWDKSVILENNKGKNISLVDNINLKEGLMTIYSISPNKHKEEMLNDVSENKIYILPDDTELFHRFGPVNTGSSSCPCGDYGGCRMLLCTEFEWNVGDDEMDFFSEDDDLIEEWFRGYCDKCLRKIGKKNYAIRQPLKYGGWKGCYCSFDCLKTQIKDPIMMPILNLMEKQLNEFNIYE